MAEALLPCVQGSEGVTGQLVELQDEEIVVES